MQVFGPGDYGADPYVWYAAQGSGGLMYFANLNGVLEFDGVRWRTIPVGRTVVRSVAADAQGQIYVGANGDLGYLAPEADGRMVFVSLREEIAPEDRTFKDVWQLLATSHGLYFCTETHIFRWSPATGLHTWRGNFHKAFALRDTVYVRHWERGLVRLDEDGFHPVPGGARFIRDAITAMMPYGPNRILIATAKGELVLYDGTGFSSFVTEADAFLRANLPAYYAFASLPQGVYALGTRHGGVVLFDRAGRLLRIVDETTGLRNNKVYFIQVDHQGGLWLCHEDGLTRLAVQAPLSYFGAASGLAGNVEALARHQRRLYAATSSGLFVLSRPVLPGQAARFQRLGDGLQCWDLLSVEDRLLAGCTDGVYEVVGLEVERVRPRGAAVFALQGSRKDASRVYLGLKDGLALLRLEEGRWIDEGRVVGVQMEVRTIEEDREGRVWLGGNNVVMQVNLEAAPAPTVRRFDARHGVAPGYTNVYRVRSQLVFAGPQGLWRVPDTEAGVETDRAVLLEDLAIPVRFLGEDDQGQVWALTASGPGVLRRAADGADRWDATPLASLAAWNLHVLYPEPDGTVWAGGVEGIARFDPTLDGVRALPLPALIRMVATINTDSLLFGGSTMGPSPPPVLAHADNGLRFSVGVPGFDRSPAERVAAHSFQFFLDGFDAVWSPWAAEAQKDYTNLPEGDYVFKVRARDVHGQISPDGRFSFTILPPWWRTGWAYLLYSLLAVGFVYSVTRWRVAHLEARTRMLERIVGERTAEVERQKTNLQATNKQLRAHEAQLEHQNIQLEGQKGQLQAQAAQLLELDEIKSRFFANISHEFRTPLTLVLGPLHDALDEAYGPVDRRLKRHLQLMERNGERLLRLINQLLDLSRLEAGGMTLRARRADLVPFLKNVVFAFASQAERKHVTLGLDAPPAPMYLYFEPDKVEKVFVNLLSNALKFTPEGGSVQVRCRILPAAPDGTGEGSVEIVVRDTGPGIPPDHLAHIFNRFYQVDDTATRMHEGTGIGLALTRELVALHGGTIRAESAPGQGATFFVRLPRGDVHLAPAQVAETEEAPVGESFRQSALQGEADPERPAPALDEAEEAPGPEAPLVLIVEDNADVRAYLREHLARHYRVEEAADGREGLRQARAIQPDLVISDVMMPRMDGYALCEAIKTDTDLGHIPVILLTAKAAEEDKVEGLETGADDYIYKPFNREELLVRAENLIEIRRLLRRRFSKEVVAVEASAVEIVPADAAFLEEAAATVEAHLTHTNFGVDWLADELGMSLRQLQRRLKDLTGLSPSGFIRTIRLQRAAQLLEQGAGNVSEIAYAVGFNDAKHFSRLFRQIFGVAPSQYPAQRA